MERNEFTNFLVEENIPLIIVNHSGRNGRKLTVGLDQYKQTILSTFLVTFKGETKKYVRIEDMAWANGLKLYDIPKAESALVRSMKMNLFIFCFYRA